MTVTAIVLAGGRSTRFGADKLAAVLGDTTVLAATLGAVATVADRVIVAGSSLPEGFDAGDVPVALVADPEPFGGPLVALAHVLGFGDLAPSDLVIVVGGDMPRLVPSVLVRMIDALNVDPTIDAVYLGRPEAASGTNPPEPSRRQALPLAARVEPASRAAREAVQAGQRSLQALLDRSTAVELAAVAWLSLDPEALTLTDIDTPADLHRPDSA